MREIRLSGSAGGAGQLNAPFLPRSVDHLIPRFVHRALRRRTRCISYSSRARSALRGSFIHA